MATFSGLKGTSRAVIIEVGACLIFVWLLLTPFASAHDEMLSASAYSQGLQQVESLKGIDRVRLFARLSYAATLHDPDQSQALFDSAIQSSQGLLSKLDNVSAYIELAFLAQRLENSELTTQYSALIEESIDEVGADLSAEQLEQLAALYFRKGLYDKSSAAANSCVSRPSALDNVLSRGKCLNILAAIKLELRAPREALPLLDEAHKELAGTEHKKPLSRVVLNYGVAYSLLGENDKSLSSYLEALNLVEQLDDPQGQAKIMNNIAVIYFNLEQFGLSRDYFERVVKLTESFQEKDIKLLSTAYANLGVVSHLLDDFEKSEVAFLMAVETARDGDNDYLEARALLHLGELYDKQKRYDKAKATLQRAMELAQTVDKKPLLIKANLGLGRLYSLLGIMDEAESYLKKGLAMAQESKMREETATALFSMSEHYYRSEQHQLAYDLLKDYTKAKNQEYKENLDSKVAEFQTLFELGQKEREIDALKSRQALQELAQRKDAEIKGWLYACLAMLGVSIAIVLNRYRMSVKSSKIISEKNQALIEAQEKLEKLALTDPLTKAKNRRAISKDMDAAMAGYQAESAGFAIILMDIDHFKQFNDTYGHDCGDFVLVEIASLIENNIRKSDELARWGGEEFIILLPELTLEQGVEFADRLRQVIAQSEFEFTGADGVNIPLKVTMTMGVAHFNGNDPNMNALIKLADERLYHGKERGRNCVVGEAEGAVVT